MLRLFCCFILSQLSFRIAALFPEILDLLRHLIFLFFLIFLTCYLFGNFLDGDPSDSDLILDLIDLVLGDIPTQIKEFISIFLDISLSDLRECLQVLEGEIGLLCDIDQSFIGHLHISYQFILVITLEYAIDDAKLASDYGHKGRIVGIFNAFVYHVDLLS